MAGAIEYVSKWIGIVSRATQTVHFPDLLSQTGCLHGGWKGSRLTPFHGIWFEDWKQKRLKPVRRNNPGRIKTKVVQSTSLMQYGLDIYRNLLVVDTIQYTWTWWQS
jgi:hypothetical protein